MGHPTMRSDWFGARRHLRVSFLVITLVLTTALGWLGWRLLEQDEQLSTQRMAEQREAAADALVTSLERRLAAIERELDRIATTGAPAAPPALDEALFVRVRETAVETWPSHALLYQPQPQTLVGAAVGDARLVDADVFEFQRRDYAAALLAIRPLTFSRDPQVAAEALARAARLRLKASQPSQAIEAYQRLSSLDTAQVGQIPAPLAAGLGRLAMAERQATPESALEAAQQLVRDANSARWPMSRATYEYLVAEAARHIPASQQAVASRIVLSDLVETLWDRWNAGQRAPSSGRLSVSTPAGSGFVVWRATPDELTAFAASTAFLSRRWLNEAAPAGSPDASVAIAGPDGRPLIGAVPASHRVATRLASATTLPWTVQAFNGSGTQARWSGRRRLLVSGLGVLLALIVAGAWFMGRSVARELAVADLQSDFVSAVSHEFRTPLTTLCQLSELLVRDRVATADDRREYYNLLYNESHRLSRLVETLLDFGRLEAGRTAFQFEPLDAAALVQESAEAFAQARQSLGHRFEVDTGAERPRVSADRDTLRCVLWNLFENAAKYSPECDTVWVALSKRGTQVEIAVRDRGVGIPRDEQRTIFDKFVRGRAARASSVRGTGIGLAMAHHIVRAHGGNIEVESEPGKGSTFRVLLPEVAA